MLSGLVCFGKNISSAVQHLKLALEVCSWPRQSLEAKKGSGKILSPSLSEADVAASKGRANGSSAVVTR